ncbi:MULTISPECIES: RloB domain-containing protein [Aeromonas]|uniref:RloB domain-containing protein n=1 Tax=Aeromonas TaxID=642 RepID=UPI000BAB1311|nr:MULTISPECIES: RloB domain-containing protein [Aeromonas]ASX10755.1 hypothetical protein CK627_08125 [Aeromonas dhakensis]MBL0660918.1 RloB domain-containing protein [Aeromonas dhakensis]MDM5120027.1 RloB domain-containing protein [Aeromonas hydrophila]HDX8359511.1 RloB domain-containing protein [Aeromonas hydrophila]
MAREKRKLHTTILFVGEGPTEKTFIEYLRGIYSPGKAKVTVRSADGKGPKHIIAEAITIQRQDDYNHCCVFLDTDLEWPADSIKKARSKKIVLIGSEPCAEGFFLDVLKMKKPQDSQGCKEAFNLSILKKKNAMIERAILEKHFTFEVLEEMRLKVAILDKIIKCLEGRVKEVFEEG